ncbi:PRC-barrel domain-containing protein [Pusillimonas sp.]|uniref:PRC-barrel domain-containing protein n=1 Tax=Pusillimonas sp. TaxID=3040095 RepID=UPI0037C7D5BA
MTMKKKLAIAICSTFALAPVAFAQTGGAVEGTSSPQSGSQTDMGADGASNSNAGSGSSDTGASTNSPANGDASGGADASTSGASTTPSTSDAPTDDSDTGAAAAPTPDAASGDSFDATLKGKSVYNENDEKVGDVKDLVMSTDGKVTHVILGVGGFVGVGEHPVAIPYDEINQSGDRVTLQGYTKDQLKEMPAFEYPKDERMPASAPATSGASPMGPR